MVSQDPMTQMSKVTIEITRMREEPYFVVVLRRRHLIISDAKLFKKTGALQAKSLDLTEHVTEST